MFSNQSNYILPLCNTYILFCIGLQNWKIRYEVVINISKNTTNRWGNDSLQNLKKLNLIALQRGRSVNVSQITLLCALHLKKESEEILRLNFVLLKRISRTRSSQCIYIIVSVLKDYTFIEFKYFVVFKQKRLFLLYRK